MNRQLKKQLLKENKLDGEIFDGDGALKNTGYLFDELEKSVNGYSKNARDSYFVSNDEVGFLCTVTKNAGGCRALVAVLYYAYCLPLTRTFRIPKKCVSAGDYAFCSSVDFSDKNNKFVLSGDGKSVKFDISCSDFFMGETLTITGTAVKSNYVISAVKPFGIAKRFFAYTHFNCVDYNLDFVMGDKNFELNRYGVVEFGRMRSPLRVYRTRAVLSSPDGEYGLSLAVGPGKSKISENAIFYEGKSSKLSACHIAVPYSGASPDYLKPWDIYTEDERAKLKFFPIIDTNNKFSKARSDSEHSVFGRYFGSVRTDDGKIVQINDCWGTVRHYRYGMLHRQSF